MAGNVHGRGACMAGEGACMAGGHTWQEAYMAGGCITGGCIAGGMYGRGVAWQGVAWQGACMAGGMCGRGHVWQGGHAWHERRPLKQTVHILLECILVENCNGSC